MSILTISPIVDICYHGQISRLSGDSKSGPHAFEVSTVFTEPSLQPYMTIFNDYTVSCSVNTL